MIINWSRYTVWQPCRGLDWVIGGQAADAYLASRVAAANKGASAGERWLASRSMRWQRQAAPMGQKSNWKWQLMQIFCPFIFLVEAYSIFTYCALFTHRCSFHLANSIKYSRFCCWLMMLVVIDKCWHESVDSFLYDMFSKLLWIVGRAVLHWVYRASFRNSWKECFQARPLFPRWANALFFYKGLCVHCNMPFDVIYTWIPCIMYYLLLCSTLYYNGSMESHVHASV